MNPLKQQLISNCTKKLQQQIVSLKQLLDEVTEAVNNETKSTVGDKHETSRAMMQLEQEKLGKQLLEAETHLAEFEKINFDIPSERITQGHLLETNKGYFFIAVSIGKTMVDEKTVFVISPNSPLASVFKGLTKNQSTSFNGTTYEIKNIL